MDILAILNRIATSATIDGVWDQAVSLFRERGFSRVNYGFTRFRNAHSMGHTDDVIYLTTFPPEYEQFYFADGFFSRTPLYRWAVENSGTCTWRWVEDHLRAGLLTADDAEAVRQNGLRGLRAGITISFPEASPREKGALGLAADDGLDHDAVDQIWAEHGAGIEAVAHVMHLRICQLPFETRRRPLSPRQREALQWVAEGKTTQDIAVLMDISPTMVEKHLRLARAALDVETTAQAVAKGTLLNQIFTRIDKPA
ncbi:MAG TPA: LuxR family transcriptional regulator [Gemmobacter sp.]|nr:MAG: hypothetical protein A2X69_00655 [Rhodobacteraceae bacterium GWF1_65_7]HBD89980.1 LuxR family transcriptional regulator [Gemmobacter sp.]